MYLLRKNIKAEYQNNDYVINGKVAFKTNITNWEKTLEPVICLVSVDSAFNNGIDGELKMNAITSIIKRNVNGKVAVLIADTAHHNVQLLKNPNRTKNDCLYEAFELFVRYSSYFEGCDLLFWSTSICQNSQFSNTQNILREMYETNQEFRKCLIVDAEKSYTEKRCVEYPDKKLFIEKTILDMIDMCACMNILASLGYKYIFYPGAPNSSTEWLSRMRPLSQRLEWIDVFLSIEKKNVMKKSEAPLLAS